MYKIPCCHKTALHTNTNTPTDSAISMVTTAFPRETLEIAASIKLRIEKYYEQLEKQVSERSNRQEPNLYDLCVCVLI